MGNKDMAMAFTIALLASGVKPKPPKKEVELDDIFKDLLNYVNSPDYTKLLIKEMEPKVKTL